MYSPFKMKGKSPMMKALIGKQNNLPAELKAKIKAAPESPAKMMKKSPAKKEESFDGAFGKARKAGKDTFMYKNKEYHTAKKGEGKIYKASYDKGGSYSTVDKSGKIARFGESNPSTEKKPQMRVNANAKPDPAPTQPSISGNMGSFKVKKKSIAKMKKKSPAKMKKESSMKMKKKSSIGMTKVAGKTLKKKTIAKTPTLPPKKLSTSSYKREYNEYKDHTARKKAIQPK
tara:strand:- start:44 stop:733 length:690 start_codon:yes stop_codon:yes gene_type:complete